VRIVAIGLVTVATIMVNVFAQEQWQFGGVRQSYVIQVTIVIVLIIARIALIGLGNNLLVNAQVTALLNVSSCRRKMKLWNNQ